MEFIEVIKGDGIKGLILPFLTFILFNILDPELGLKMRLGETPSLFAYGILSILIYIILVTLWDWLFVSRRVKFEAIPIYFEPLPPPYYGARHYAVLKVVIPKGWEITDCFVTLENDIRVYEDDRILLDPKREAWVTKSTWRDYNVLRWKSPLENSYKITIGENSNEVSLLVAVINLGIHKAPKNIVLDINSFDFCFWNENPLRITTHRLGLRRISLSLHWKHNSKRMTNKRFNGYIYSDVDGIKIDNVNPRIIIRAGDYTKDKDIPKPLPKKTKEVHAGN